MDALKLQHDDVTAEMFLDYVPLNMLYLTLLVNHAERACRKSTML